MCVSSVLGSSGASVLDAMTNPYVFVVGCQRSGTTMLQRMLDAHPRLAVAYDSLFIPRVIKGDAPGIDPEMTPDIVRTVREHPRFGRLGLSEEGVGRASSGARRYSGFVSRIYDELALLHHKPFAGEKSPGYCRHIPHLHALLPWTKIIHLIRDGRDVALSIRSWGKGAAKLELARAEPIGVGALWWRRDVSRGCGDGRGLPSSSYREVRYEALVREPESSLRELASFLGLEYSEEMAQYHQGRVKASPGLSAKAAWLPPTQGVRDWRTQLAEEDQELFEAIAGEELAMLGYERRFSRFSTRVIARAEACLRWWETNEG